MPQPLVYFDHAATTPLDERVLESMLPFFGNSFGNPSSIHRWGQRAEAAVEQARESIAGLLACAPDEVVFTSCGTESDNLALRGAAFAARNERGARHVLVSPVDHHAVTRTAEQLGSLGFDVELFPVDEFGCVDPDILESRLRSDTAIASVIYANNEIGSINPISDLGQVCRRHYTPLHSDAVQAAGQLPMRVAELNVDLFSLGAHKFYGPKGVGVLYVRRGTTLFPSLTGGSQEFGLRPGTHNVPLIVGMAKAFEIAVAERQVHNQHYLALRRQLIEGVVASIPHARLTGHPTDRLPNHASFVFRDVDGNQLLAALDLEGFGCSSGSACKTGQPEPSDVLTAIGLPPEWSLGSLRVTFGRSNTAEQVEQFLACLPKVIARLRGGR
jgi:cysteine desulfurase